MAKLESKPGYATIPEATKIVEVTDSKYVRALMKKGKFPGAVKRMINDKQWRWEIPIKELERYAKRDKRTRRTDGRTRYIIWMRDDEEKAVSNLFEKNGIEAPYEKAYQPKDEDEDEEDES